jgi:hypothetical protein
VKPRAEWAGLPDVHAYRLQLIRDALTKLRNARDLLRYAKANRAATYVARALKSAEGAERHAENAPFRAARG